MSSISCYFIELSQKPYKGLTSALTRLICTLLVKCTDCYYSKGNEKYFPSTSEPDLLESELDSKSHMSEFKNYHFSHH